MFSFIVTILNSWNTETLTKTPYVNITQVYFNNKNAYARSMPVNGDGHWINWKWFLSTFVCAMLKLCFISILTFGTIFGPHKRYGQWFEHVCLA